MRSLNVDNFDIVLDNKKCFEVVDGKRELEQSFKLLIQTNLKEWFLNQGMGLDYKQLQGKNVDEDFVRFAFIDCLEQHPAFEELISFEFTLNKYRKATINAQIRADNEIMSVGMVTEV